MTREIVDLRVPDPRSLHHYLAGSLRVLGGSTTPEDAAHIEAARDLLRGLEELGYGADPDANARTLPGYERRITEDVAAVPKRPRPGEKCPDCGRKYTFCEACCVWLCDCGGDNEPCPGCGDQRCYNCNHVLGEPVP